jgi:hypothetical protein
MMNYTPTHLAVITSTPWLCNVCNVTLAEPLYKYHVGRWPLSQVYYYTRIVRGTWFISTIRYMRWKDPTQLHPLKMANPDHDRDYVQFNFVYLFSVEHQWKLCVAYGIKQSVVHCRYVTCIHIEYLLLTVVLYLNIRCDLIFMLVQLYSRVLIFSNKPGT